MGMPSLALKVEDTLEEIRVSDEPLAARKLSPVLSRYRNHPLSSASSRCGDVLECLALITLDDLAGRAPAVPPR
jgi:hypothetical protein